MWFTHEGIWGFNQAHLVGIEVAGLPIEEWLFFITVPYACVFTYACMKRYFPISPLGLGHRSVTTAAIAICLAIALQHLDKAYLGLTAGLCAVWLFITLVRWNTWMGHFWLTYVILLVPFVISNGVLTGIQFWEYPFLHDSPESIADQIVWYNNTENSGWRLLAMPVDDLLYGLLLIGVNVSLFEAFSRRDPTAHKSIIESDDGHYRSVVAQHHVVRLVLQHLHGFVGQYGVYAHSRYRPNVCSSEADARCLKGVVNAI